MFLWRKTNSVHKIKMPAAPNSPISQHSTAWTFVTGFTGKKKKGMSTFLHGKHISITWISSLSALKSCNTMKKGHYVFFLWELLILILIKVFVFIRDSFTKQNTENQYVSSFLFSASGMQKDMALGGE